MAISKSLEEHLNSRGIPYETVPHSHTATSMQTAQAAHVSGEFVAKGVVLAEEDAYLLAVLPASAIVQPVFAGRPTAMLPLPSGSQPVV